jgi:hypothetical protein
MCAFWSVSVNCSRLTLPSLPAAGCCRVLGELPLLTTANLSTSTPLAEVPIPAIPRDLLPSLRSLTRLSSPGTFSEWLNLAAQNLTPLHVLARWTNIPHPVLVHFQLPTSAAAKCLALKGWSSDWVVSVLGSLHKDQPPLLLVDDADVDLLLGALRDGAGAIQSMGPLWLGGGVTLAALRRLLRCEQLPGSSLFIDAPPEEVMPYVVGWEGGLRLSSRHFMELLGAGPLPGLRSLCVAGCQGLEDEGVAALARAAGELRCLSLLGASKVGDTALAALAVGCHHLERLTLRDAGRVTVGGLRVLVAVAARLTNVQLVGLRVQAAEKLCSEIVALRASPAGGVFDGWQAEVSQGGARMTLRRKHSPAARPPR